MPNSQEAGEELPVEGAVLQLCLVQLHREEAQGPERTTPVRLLQHATHVGVAGIHCQHQGRLRVRVCQLHGLHQLLLDSQKGSLHLLGPLQLGPLAST